MLISNSKVRNLLSYNRKTIKFILTFLDELFIVEFKESDNEELDQSPSKRKRRKKKKTQKEVPENLDDLPDDSVDPGTSKLHKKEKKKHKKDEKTEEKTETVKDENYELVFSSFNFRFCIASF